MKRVLSKVLIVCLLHAAWVVLSPAGFGTVFADTVYLKRGGTIEGEVVQGRSTVEVKVDGGSTVFNNDDIERIEKGGTRKGSAAGVLAGWKSGAEKALNSTKRQAAKALEGTKKTTAGWMKPIQRDPAIVAKEKQVNDTLLEMQDALKKTHAQEKAIAEQKRALKQNGLDS